MEISYTSIGVIHSPFKTIEGMPIQPSGAAGVRGTIELFPIHVPALKDLDGFSHLFLLYHFHLVDGVQLVVTPFLDVQPHGLFATRAPKRPNPIGLSVVKLMSVEGNLLHVENIDVIDGTPLLDIKPYVPEFDVNEDVRVGWLEQAKGRAKDRRSDSRFK
jgi:tRNA-Thr(GGU) m(6)t(6)A37 methyltransferase TsaA